MSDALQVLRPGISTLALTVRVKVQRLLQLLESIEGRFSALGLAAPKRNSALLSGK